MSALTELPANLRNNPRLDRWVGVSAADGIAIRSGKVELGQGVAQAMTILAASELGVRPDAIRLLPTDTGAAPNEGYTAGSFSIQHGGAAMQAACAQVRGLFTAAAAQALGVDAGEVELEDGVFRPRGRNAGLGYADLAAEVDLSVSALDLPLPVLRGLDDGARRSRRADLPAKLRGAAYIQDLRLPGQLYGRMLRAEAPNLRPSGIDVARVRAAPGVVEVVVDGAFVGVIARTDEAARQAVALARRTAEWTTLGPLPEDDAAQSWMDAGAPEAQAVIDEGASPAGPTVRYARPYLAHAAMGPSCAVAQWRDGRLTVHSHSQGIHPLRGQLATALGLSLEVVDLVHVPGAGCYGHNGADDVAFDAARLAQAVDAPVMVTWSREDELSWSPHGAAMRVDLSADLEQGRIAAWRAEVWSTPHLARPGIGDGVNLLGAWDLERPCTPSGVGMMPGLGDQGGDRNAVPLYDLPRKTILYRPLPQGPLRSSAMRSLGAHCNVFALEGFMDELADRAGADPVDFRLAHCSDSRMRGVIEAAAQAAGWEPAAEAGTGRGRGIAVARYKNAGAYYAACVEVEVEDSVRLVSVHGAVDAGVVVHPDGLLNQVEGGVVQAASWTLKEAAHWTPEGFASNTWDSYPVLGFAETPPIETVILASEAPSLGAGECAAGPVAAAIGNAVAHALGVRIRQMPLTRERIMQALLEA